MARPTARRSTCLALLLGACSSPQHPPSEAADPAAFGCLVTLGLSEVRPLTVSVSTSCPEKHPTEYLAEPGVDEYLKLPTGEVPLALGHRRLSVPNGKGIRYRVELGRMAAETDDFNRALQVGDSLIAPGYSWLLSPLGIPGDTRVELRLAEGLNADSFVTGLTPGDAGYSLRVNEIPVATFGVFGHFEQAALDLKGRGQQPARLRVVTLDGNIAAGPRVVERWVLETAQAVAEFYAGFPVENAMLALVPIPGRRSVLHGKVLPESSPGIAVLVGSEATTRDLYGDWILTHELFHLGFPSFIDEGKWLDEGLATYFEPLIRARQGWVDERDVWAEFYQNMPRGLGVLERDGLETPRSVRGMYWAGATVCLLADVEAHRHSHNQRGLRQGLLGLLAHGGEASRVWALEDAVGQIDGALGAPILAKLQRRYGTAKKRVPLAQLFRDLGVRPRGDSVELDDAAPLAAVRRAITSGHP